MYYDPSYILKCLVQVKVDKFWKDNTKILEYMYLDNIIYCIQVHPLRINTWKSSKYVYALILIHRSNNLNSERVKIILTTNKV